MSSFTVKKIESKLEWLAERKNGIGTSELDQMCGASPFGTAADLWQLKTGLVPPVRENEDMRRGHELEPSVRKAFMELVDDNMELEYHEYWTYSCDELPMVFSTLDGILTAKRDFTLSLSGQDMAFRKGERAILEIKNPKPRTASGYDAWDNLPEHYRYQNAGQMLCSGIRKHIEVANLTGEFASPGANGMDLRIFFSEYGDYLAIMDEIRKTAPVFWEKVKSRQPASVATKVGDGEIIVFESKVNAGSIIENFDVVKTSIQVYANSFKGLTFTEDEEKKAKDFRAELNKQIKTIETVRTSTKKAWEEPLKAFESKCKELVQIIKEVEEPIAQQLSDFEDKRKAEKASQCKAIIDEEMKGAHPDVVFLIEQSKGIAINDKWLNKGTSLKAIKEEVKAIIATVGRDMDVLGRVLANSSVEERNGIILAYCDNNRSLDAALAQADRYEEYRKAQEARALAKKEAEEARAKAAQIKAPEPPMAEPIQAEKEKEEVESPAPTEEEPKVYRLVVEFKHTNRDELVAFSKYLKEHGFTFRNVTAEFDAKTNN